MSHPTEFVTSSAPAKQSRESLYPETFYALRENLVGHAGQDFLFVIAYEYTTAEQLYATSPVTVCGSEVNSCADLSIDVEDEEDQAWSALTRKAFRQTVRQDD